MLASPRAWPSRGRGAEQSGLPGRQACAGARTRPEARGANKARRAVRTPRRPDASRRRTPRTGCSHPRLTSSCAGRDAERLGQRAAAAARAGPVSGPPYLARGPPARRGRSRPPEPRAEGNGARSRRGKSKRRPRPRAAPAPTTGATSPRPLSRPPASGGGSGSGPTARAKASRRPRTMAAAPPAPTRTCRGGCWEL